MSYQNAMDALNLIMPKRIPRTEYSASSYWALIQKVTGLTVDETSPSSVKNDATRAFEKAWQFDFSWNVDISRGIFGDLCTSMGHAVYQQGGTDFDSKVYCPFEDEDEVLAFDPYKAYGERDEAEIIRCFNQRYAQNRALHPDQVVTSGIYVSMVSGLLEIFGWDMLLLALGVDQDGMGQVANRYADWILQYFKALSKCDAPVVMVHDDIVWTAGPFVSPEWYRKYVFPNYQKLFEPLYQAGKRVIYTSDGNYSQFIDDVAACGVNGFVMEPTTDMAYIAQKYGKTHAFIGNADCRILTYGTKEEIRREVERCVDLGRDCPGFIMAVGNHLPASVPVDNAIYYNQVFEELRDRR